jgi:two-component system OmpR family response regulator
VIDVAGLRLDPAAQRIVRNDEVLDLTSLEYRALSYFMMHPAKVVSKTELTEHIYGQDDDRDSNVIEVLVNRLRKKIGAELIRTRRGQGYELGVS